MSDGQLERLIYYPGQLLTSKDFEDQQEYHRKKLQQFIERFPYGIVRGLHVSFDSPKEPPNDFEAFKITEGLAVDVSGNAIVVGSEGIRISVDEFNQKKPEGQNHLFLSIFYTEKKGYSATSARDSSTKNNRITEAVEHSWDESSNQSISHIALAKITSRPNGGFIIDEEQAIRRDAGLIQEEQLSDELKGKLVTDAVQAKLVAGGNSHNHTGDGGAKIPEGGLAPEVTAQLVTQGDSHDHTNDHGAPIPEAGLDSAVQDKLVDGGNNHNHTGGGGAQVPVAGLAPEVTDRLVTQGDSHDHTDDHGAPIPEAGLDDAVRAKLVDGGNAHGHSGLVTIHTVTLDEAETTIPAEMSSATVTIERVEKNAIIHVVPTQGVISWTFTVRPNEEDEDFLTYTITIINIESSEDPDGTSGTDVTYEVRKFVFGAG